VLGRTSGWTSPSGEGYRRADVSYRRILVGTDGSPPSLKSVREAAMLAKGMEAELLVMTAYEPVDQATLERWKDEAPAEFAWRFSPSSGAEEAVEKGLEAARELGVEAKPLVEHGEAGEALIRAAEREGVDLLVVGNRGMAGPTRFLLGSVPNKVSHAAPCDLLIVKTVS
jgi:nucleotide-binding universal stress UspA family protein